MATFPMSVIIPSLLSPLHLGTAVTDGVSFLQQSVFFCTDDQPTQRVLEEVTAPTQSGFELLS